MSWRLKRAIGQYPGSYGINDYALLLGKDGKVAGVVDINATDYLSTALLSGGSRISEDEDKKGTSEYYVNVLRSMQQIKHL